MAENAPVNWRADADVDMWGPTVHIDAPPAPVASIEQQEPLRRRKPWGLGDVFATFGLIIAGQLLLIPFLLVGAVVRLGSTLGDMSTWGPAQFIAIIDEVSKVATEPLFLVVALASQWLVFAGYPWLVARRKGLRSLARDYGFTFTRKDIPFGIALAIALQVLMSGFGWLVQAVGVDVTGSDNTSMVTDHHGPMLALMVLAAAVGAPLTEELLFRGLAFRAMLRSFAHVDLAQDPHFAQRHARTLALKGAAERSPRARTVGVVASVVVSSLLFGVMHTPAGEGVTFAAQAMLIFQTGLLGAVFAVVAYRTRRLGMNIVAHMVFNSVSVALALVLGGS